MGLFDFLLTKKQTASVAEWNRTHGRHPVYAKGQDLPLPAKGKNRRLPVLET